MVPRRWVAVLCIAIVAVAAVTSAGGVMFDAILAPVDALFGWCPDPNPANQPATPPVLDRAVALLPSRAPPAIV